MSCQGIGALPTKLTSFHSEPGNEFASGQVPNDKSTHEAGHCSAAVNIHADRLQETAQHALRGAQISCRWSFLDVVTCSQSLGFLLPSAFWPRCRHPYEERGCAEEGTYSLSGTLSFGTLFCAQGSGKGQALHVLKPSSEQEKTAVKDF